MRADERFSQIRRPARHLACRCCLVGLCTALATAAPASESYHIGLDFVDEPFFFAGYWKEIEITPYVLTETDPPTFFVQDGALAGWVEEDARCQAALWVEDAFRWADTEDPGTTLAMAVHRGLVPQDVSGRRLNLALGRGEEYETAYGYADGLGMAFDEEDYPNDTYVGLVFLDNIEGLSEEPGVSYDAAEQAFNAIGGTTAHEVGHVFALEHLDRGDEPPYPIMATGTTGLLAADRLTLRRFSDEAGTQPGGESSQSALVGGIGTVARGDYDFDGDVDLDDASVLTGHWRQTQALYQEGDADSDHDVDLDDASVLIGHFGGGFDAGAGTAEISWDDAADRVVVDASGVALVKIQSSDGAFVENGYTPCVGFSTVQQPGPDGEVAGEFMTSNNITGTGYVDLALESGTVTLTYQLVGEEPVLAGTIPIPEPASAAILGMGGLAGLLRRRRGR